MNERPYIIHIGDSFSCTEEEARALFGDQVIDALFDGAVVLTEAGALSFSLDWNQDQED